MRNGKYISSIFYRIACACALFKTIQDVGLSSSIGSLANHVKANKRAFSFHFNVVLLAVVTLPECPEINRAKSKR